MTTPVSYSVFKQRFKKTIAETIFNEITSNTATYYHWFGKENTWTDFLSPFIDSSDGDYPGEPSDNFRYELHVRRDILTAKRIKSSDVSYIVRRIDWTSDTVFDMYDDAYSTTENDGKNAVGYYGAVRLEDANFYVLTTQYNVYKCIDNNNNAPSTVMPTGNDNSVFTTADNYKWKFMYSIPASLRNRFLTDTHMPVLTALKNQFYSSGTINVINIENGGTGYHSGTTTATISGNGYKEFNPYAISGFTVDTVGDGYSDITLTVSDPFSGTISWSSAGSVAPGSYVTYTNPATERKNFYYVVSGTLLGTSAPIHTLDISNNPITQTNGGCQLRYAGTTAVAEATLDGSSIDTTTLIDAGYGYQSVPTVTISDPVERDASWTSNTLVALGAILVHDNIFYEVTQTGTTGLTAPTHTTGEEDNGTAKLTYVATAGTISVNGDQTEAEIELIIDGGCVVGYIIVDGGVGYTSATITITDTDPTPGTGAILVPDFTVGDIDTLQANVELLAVPGSIEAIKVVDGGAGYGAATCEILGDGMNATADVICSGGAVVGISITDPGEGYTWTDVKITGNPGSSGTASARAIMSPLGGHGSNAINELNANSLVFFTSISDDKNQGISINNDYRKVGLVRNFKRFGSNARFTDDIGSGCVLITADFDSTQLDYDMLLYKSEGTGDTADDYKKYRVVDFTDTQILLSVFNDFSINNGDVLRTDPTDLGSITSPPQSAISFTVDSVTERTIDQFSGDFLFFSVREPYQPTTEQIITVRTVITI